MKRALVLILCLFLFACGKKAPPKPIDKKPKTTGETKQGAAGFDRPHLA